jgi:transposase-like protein
MKTETSKYKCPSCGKFSFHVISSTRSGKHQHRCRDCGHHGSYFKHDLEVHERATIRNSAPKVTCECGEQMKCQHRFETNKGNARLRYHCPACNATKTTQPDGKIAERGVWKSVAAKAVCSCGASDFKRINGHKGSISADCNQCGARWTLYLETGKLEPRYTRQERGAMRSGTTPEQREAILKMKAENKKAAQEKWRAKQKAKPAPAPKPEPKPKPKPAPAPRPPREPRPPKRGTMSTASRLDDLREARALRELQNDYV